MSADGGHERRRGVSVGMTDVTLAALFVVHFTACLQMNYKTKTDGIIITSN